MHQVDRREFYFIGYVRQFENMPSFSVPVFEDGPSKYVQVGNSTGRLVEGMKPLSPTSRLVIDESRPDIVSGYGRELIYGFHFDNVDIIGPPLYVAEMLKRELTWLRRWPFVYLAVSDLISLADVGHGPRGWGHIPGHARNSGFKLYDAMVKFKQQEALEMFESRATASEFVERDGFHLVSVSTGDMSDQIGRDIEHAQYLTNEVTHLYPGQDPVAHIAGALKMLERKPSRGFVFYLDERFNPHARRIASLFTQRGFNLFNMPTAFDYARTLDAIALLRESKLLSFPNVGGIGKRPRF